MITKIIASIGPASENLETLEKLFLNGASIFRINMSHGTKASHQKIIDNINILRKRGYPIEIMLDTKGPEIRVGTFEKGEIFLSDKQNFTLTTRNILGNQNVVSLVYKKLIDVINVGDKIFANNGMVVLKVKELTSTDIICKVLYGGKLTNNKGLNIPRVVPEGEYLSETDKNDILFAIKNKANYLASSFVSNKQNIAELRAFLEKNNAKNVKIISKIENSSGIKNLSDIVSISEGVIVARGDLGVEIPFEKVPHIQKKIIAECLKQNKMSIVATEMLESMTHSIRPTRAEVSDVANAVYERVSATMLSGETAVGKHPELVVKTMAKIIKESEKHIVS